MRAKTTTALLGAAALGSAFLVTGGASAAQEDAATGGGQIVVSSDGGAGDTIAFTAKGTAEEGTGQIQYVDRSGGTGQDQVVRHATVLCIAVDGNSARITGEWRDDETLFGIYVQDNGEGANADGEDIVTLMQEDITSCDWDAPEEEDQAALARGNAQVRDNTP